MEPGSLRLVEEVGDLLRSRGLRLVVAESCTGGLLGAHLTSVAGSSDWFLGGAISYANELKSALLGVRAETLAQHGAVSAECAREMADGALDRMGADVAVSVTGIAGPGGGTPEKPVGLVYLGLAGPSAGVRELRLHGTRDEIRRATVESALSWLRDILRG